MFLHATNHYFLSLPNYTVFFTYSVITEIVNIKEQNSTKKEIKVYSYFSSVTDTFNFQIERLRPGFWNGPIT
jgi:hypothetical protein